MRWFLLLVPTFVVYLLASFVGWNWNPGDWLEFGRLVAAISSLILTLPILAALLD